MGKSLTAINNKIQEDLSKERDAKCEPVAEQILQIVAKHKPSASITNAEKDHQDMLEAYTPIYEEIMTLALEKDLTIPELEYTMSIVLAFFDLTKMLTTRSINSNFEIAQRKLWGKDPSDLTLKELDSILKGKSA